MNNEQIWLAMIGMALVTVASRVLPLLLMRSEPAPWLRTWLSFVPPAVFAALIVPPLLLASSGTGRIVQLGPALPAGLIGVLVAWRSGNVLLTLAAGLISFWVLRAAGF
ncbi:MAG TPA: AzlD domain-containing protein [Roseiflexaceae bacterium]|nr:AzlD domain-containing protein [Roseiflexaceae bacterium]